MHLTVNTPYPGTETWLTESRKLTSRDYRLFDVQHAVLPTTLPLQRFYEELVRTQAVLNRKHLGWAALQRTARIGFRLLLQGQTNFLRMLWRFNRVYNPERLYRDHFRPVKYTMRPWEESGIARPTPAQLYVHAPRAAAQRSPRRTSGALPQHQAEHLVSEGRHGVRDDGRSHAG